RGAGRLRRPPVAAARPGGVAARALSREARVLQSADGRRHRRRHSQERKRQDRPGRAGGALGAAGRALTVRAIPNVIRAVLGPLIFAGVALNFANVVGRYVFFKPIIWAEEVLVFIMIWCVMLGATVVTWENQHRSEEHTSELQSLAYLVCRLLLEKK